jgi:hypothetical protein
MKDHLVKLFPYLLVTSYLILCHFRTPNIADSIIIVGLLSYLGYNKFLSTKETPDIRKEVVQEITKFRKDITEMQTELNQVSLASKGTFNAKYKF